MRNSQITQHCAHKLIYLTFVLSDMVWAGRSTIGGRSGAGRTGSRRGAGSMHRSAHMWMREDVSMSESNHDRANRISCVRYQPAAGAAGVDGCGGGTIEPT